MIFNQETVRTIKTNVDVSNCRSPHNYRQLTKSKNNSIEKATGLVENNMMNKKANTNEIRQSKYGTARYINFMLSKRFFLIYLQFITMRT